ncbi:MAG: hypothetical protein QF637_10455 [Acidimicrobiales bacterium]|nr:hypothetical protein [Acidimicrobiales bacterium]
MNPSIAELHVSDDPIAWERVGFRVETDRCLVGTTGVVFRDGQPGIHSWALRDAQPSEFGPIPTSFVESPTPSPSPAHPNGSIGFHHVVLMVPEFERGRSALTDAGVIVSPGQAFGSSDKQLLRSAPQMGDIDLELIGPVKEDRSRRWELWGLVIAVEDIDGTADLLGDLLGRIKPAVQPRRRIATLARSAGLGVAIAFLGPEETL